VPEDLPPIVGVASELNQVWSNLIDNALDAVPEHGHIQVCVRRCVPDGIRVSVIDDGPGIPVHLQKRIFDPFFTTKPVGEGTGLGLDIARRLVRQYDGNLDFDTKPGRTEFRVTLPGVTKKE
jgi:signal transduction histidine kinase